MLFGIQPQTLKGSEFPGNSIEAKDTEESLVLKLIDHLNFANTCLDSLNLEKNPLILSSIPITKISTFNLI